LRENAKNYSKTCGDFGCAQENGEAFAHSDVLASRLRVLQVLPPTGDEHNPNHDVQKKKRDVNKLG
jgi:hypothetical protein